MNDAKKVQSVFTSAFLALVWMPCCVAAGEMLLDYQTPAREWTEALPLGNGRLGAMPFGGVEEDRILLNEDTIITGGPVVRGDEPITSDMVKKCRERLFAGKNQEARKTLPDKFGQSGAYQPFGELLIRHTLPAGGETQAYRRSLSLDDAVARTSFRRGGVLSLRLSR